VVAGCVHQLHRDAGLAALAGDSPLQDEVCVELRGDGRQRLLRVAELVAGAVRDDVQRAVAAKISNQVISESIDPETAAGPRGEILQRQDGEGGPGCKGRSGRWGLVV
jgi:hypothetical protein